MTETVRPGPSRIAVAGSDLAAAAGIMGVGWRRLLLPRFRRKSRNLPISGGCDSRVRVGFEVWGELIHSNLRRQRLSQVGGPEIEQEGSIRRLVEIL